LRGIQFSSSHAAAKARDEANLIEAFVTLKRTAMVAGVVYVCEFRELES
jgi:hypothetical protein